MLLLQHLEVTVLLAALLLSQTFDAASVKLVIDRIEKVPTGNE
jgi:hypothetical protein